VTIRTAKAFAILHTETLQLNWQFGKLFENSLAQEHQRGQGQHHRDSKQRKNQEIKFKKPLSDLRQALIIATCLELWVHHIQDDSVTERYSHPA